MQLLTPDRPPVRKQRGPATILILTALTLALTTAVSFVWAHASAADAASPELLALRQAVTDAEGRQTELQAEIDRLVEELERLRADYQRLEREKEAWENGRPVAYITIDDGPSLNTLKVLEILRNSGVPATFFVTGNNLSGHQDIYGQIVADGHAIGIHSYTHHYKTVYACVDSFFADFRRLEDFLYREFGIRTNIMRFPGGSSSTVCQAASGYDIIVEDLIREVVSQGYDYFDWNVDSGDALPGATAGSIISTTKEQIARLHGRDLVLLFHDGPASGATVEALPSVIHELKASGYRFEVLSKGVIDVKHRTAQG